MFDLRSVVGIGAAALLAGGEARAQQEQFVEQGVACRIEGRLTYEGPGNAVAEDHDPINRNPLAPDQPIIDDPLADPPLRPAVATTIDAAVSECVWLLAEEHEPCFPAEGIIAVRVTGDSVTDNACASRTFKGTFTGVARDGAPLEPGACSGTFFCGHSALEIGVDIAKQIDGGPERDGGAKPGAGNPLSRGNPVDLVKDPGSVDGEPNNGRGEAPPFTESCTFELKTTIDGGAAVRRFGLAAVALYEDTANEGTLADLFAACAEFADCSAAPESCGDPAREPASAPFLGLMGSSAGF